MATILPIGIGTVPNDGLGDTIRDAFDKCNANFAALNVEQPDLITQPVKAAVALTKGQAVYVSGANGTNVLVSKASNVTEATSSKTLGLISTDLALNAIGEVVTEGMLSGLNTSTATAGDPVWLGVNGALIYGFANKPVAPAHMVFIGYVLRSNVSNGEIYVKVQNGFELEELHNVSITSPINDQSLIYESGTGLWKNKSLATINGNSIIDTGNVVVGNVTSYGTDGYIPKTITGNQLVDSPMYTDGTNVTINTNSPTAKFDVLGNGSSGESLMALRNNDSFDLFRVVTDYDSQNFEVKFGEVGQQYGLPSFFMDQNYSYFKNTNLGIGVPTPTEALEVDGRILCYSTITASGGDSNYWNAKQEQLVSGSNIKTVNGQSLLGSGGINIDVPIKGIHGIVPVPTSSGMSYTQCLNASGFSVMNGVANRMYLAPFIPANTFTSISMSINVTTVVAGALIRILLYNSVNGKPSAKLWESTSLDAGSLTGVKTATLNTTFIAGTTYWIGVQSSSTAGTYALQTSQMTPLYNTNGSANICAYYLTAAIGSAPATITSGLTQHSNTIPLAVINV